MRNAAPGPTMMLALALAGAVMASSCSSGSKPATSASAAAGTTMSSAATGSGGSASWTTFFHDSGRTGVAPDGPATPAAVRRQWVSRTLDGDIYAEPLPMGDRVVVATQNDTVYALDAGTGVVEWSRHLGTPVPASALPCGNVDPVGITATPVVDAGTGRIYASALLQPARHLLLALDLATGSLVASAGVDGPGADPTTHNRRGALTLAGGRVLVPVGGRYGDCGVYHGEIASVPLRRWARSAEVAPTCSCRAVKWTAPLATPGPAIVSTGAVWTVATGSGPLMAFDLSSGRRLTSQPIGRVPSQGRVVVAADRRVMAFGDGK